MNTLLDAVKWDEKGLVCAIAQDAKTLRVLMVAWMDAEALRRTVTTGAGTYWSRSRQEYWVKGATSGHTQRVVELRRDCERDAHLDRPDLWSDVKRVLAEGLQPQALQTPARRLPAPVRRRPPAGKRDGLTLF